MLTAVDYTVKLEGGDPTPLFVIYPDEEALADILSKHVALCGATCNPSLCQSFLVRGKIVSQDVDDIKSALVEAFVAVNPGSKQNDYDVVLSSINDELNDADG